MSKLGGPQTVGQRIEAARRELRYSEGKRVTQAMLADRVGVVASTVSKWETDDKEISGENLVKLAEALGKSERWIIYGDEPAARPGRDASADLNRVKVGKGGKLKTKADKPQTGSS